MYQVQPTPVLLTDAVLLVLLPPVSSPEAEAEPNISAVLRRLQDRLSPAIRVLRIDEASHPSVVRSFGLEVLPAYVLVRQGVELWRQQGLPDGDGLVSTLLSKLNS